MSWILPSLDTQVQVGTPIQTANAKGGADFSFKNLMTIWMEFKPVGYKTSGTKYVRGKQVNTAVTHEFRVMALEVELLGREFTAAFGIGFKGIGTLNPLKSDYFLFVQEERSTTGRLFRIHEMQKNMEEDEFISILAEEIEEQGVGWPE